MKEVLQYFKDHPIYFLATAEGDQPRVRPFGAVAEYEGKLYMCTNSRKPVFRQLKENPKVEICGSDGGAGWLRVEAKAVVDDSREAKAQMLEQNPGLKNMYAPDDEIFEVFYLTEATAVFSSMTEEPRVVKFS